MIKISILICALVERREKFQLLKTELEKQCNGLPVEILSCEDNREISVGAKRNLLLKKAKGEYVGFVDDDDWISPDYVQSILQRTRNNPDVISFNVLFTNDEGTEIQVFISREYLNTNNIEKKIRYRMPNHLCFIKREIALRCPFQEKNFGEDTAYGIAIRPHLKKENKIEKNLYFYRFNTVTSATHQFNPANKLAKPEEIKHDPPIKMDVVMVSNGEKELKKTTQTAINSILGEDVNIIVIEKNPFVRYVGADTFKQREPFNYNQCLNDGAMQSNAELICFCNNDIKFPKSFVKTVRMLMGDFDILSVKDNAGFMPKNNISGHCFIIKRSAYNKLQGFDESFPFECSDNVIQEAINATSLKHIKTNIQVWHERHATLKGLSLEKKQEYTYKSRDKFLEKYHKEAVEV